MNTAIANTVTEINSAQTEEEAAMVEAINEAIENEDQTDLKILFGTLELQRANSALKSETLYREYLSAKAIDSRKFWELCDDPDRKKKMKPFWDKMEEIYRESCKYSSDSERKKRLITRGLDRLPPEYRIIIVNYLTPSSRYL